MTRLAGLAAALFAAQGAVAAPVLVVSSTALDWGNVAFGVPTATQALYLTNGGDAPLTLDGFGLTGAQNYALGGPCNQVFTLAPGASCRFDISLTLTNAVAGAITARLDIDSNAGATVEVQLRAYNVGAGSPAATLTVVEYYNAVLDHYFITWVAAEQANLDAGNTPTRWTRTGYSFRALAAAQAGSSPVCRYYIPPALGDSHFFGRGTVECDATGRDNPTFVLESTEFMHIHLPAAGTCPAATTPVYRAFSNRADANHRYMTDRAVRDAMVASGWLAEGDGPDLVVMCAPA
jgi:hypothetical protein